jgi:hypothetical protein
VRSDRFLALLTVATIDWNQKTAIRLTAQWEEGPEMTFPGFKIA